MDGCVCRNHHHRLVADRHPGDPGQEEARGETNRAFVSLVEGRYRIPAVGVIPAVDRVGSHLCEGGQR